MSQKKQGQRTFLLPNPPSLIGHAAVVGKKEGQGPLANSFDYINEDTTFGEKTWEKAESRMQQEAITRAVAKAKISPQELDLIFAGDLINQCIASAFGMRDTDVPFLGLYGACSTMAESLLLSALMIDGGYADHVCAVTSSHFCTAERQFRSPLEYGGQRTPTAQWTVTGSGAAVLAAQGNGPFIKRVTVGKLVDYGILDVNNMGAAMAPAAYDTIRAFFQDTNTAPEQFDRIITGDLGLLGKEILIQGFQEDGIALGDRYDDCGAMIFSPTQDVHCGGSGCGCAASVLCGYLLNGMREGRWNRILFCATGALTNTVSFQQGQSIPSICHLVEISNNREADT